MLFRSLQCSEFNDLYTIGFVRTFFIFKSHCGESDRKTMIGYDLHHSVIHKEKSTLLTNYVYTKQDRSTEKCRRNQAFAKKRNLGAHNIACQQKQHKQTKLYQKAPNGRIVGKGKVPARRCIHILHFTFLCKSFATMRDTRRGEIGLKAYNSVRMKRKGVAL